jgi:predicted Zn-dependent protease with MMP-like domain
MSSRSKELQRIAEDEVRRVLTALPVPLQAPSSAIPLVYDWRTIDALDAEGVGDTLGLFVGDNLLEAAQGNGGLPAQIILYLENLWAESGEDETVYRREVRITFLHELGHYLGLEEIELEDRGL